MNKCLSHNYFQLFSKYNTSVQSVPTQIDVFNRFQIKDEFGDIQVLTTYFCLQIIYFKMYSIHRIDYSDLLVFFPLCGKCGRVTYLSFIYVVKHLTVAIFWLVLFYSDFFILNFFGEDLIIIIIRDMDQNSSNSQSTSKLFRNHEFLVSQHPYRHKYFQIIQT